MLVDFIIDLGTNSIHCCIALAISFTVAGGILLLPWPKPATPTPSSTPPGRPIPFTLYGAEYGHTAFARLSSADARRWSGLFFVRKAGKDAFFHLVAHSEIDHVGVFAHNMRNPEKHFENSYQLITDQHASEIVKIWDDEAKRRAAQAKALTDERQAQAEDSRVCEAMNAACKQLVEFIENGGEASMPAFNFAGRPSRETALRYCNERLERARQHRDRQRARQRLTRPVHMNGSSDAGIVFGSIVED